MKPAVNLVAGKPRKAILLGDRPHHHDGRERADQQLVSLHRANRLPSTKPGPTEEDHFFTQHLADGAVLVLDEDLLPEIRNAIELIRSLLDQGVPNGGAD